MKSKQTYKIGNKDSLPDTLPLSTFVLKLLRSSVHFLSQHDWDCLTKWNKGLFFKFSLVYYCYWWEIQLREFTNAQSLMKIKKMFAGKIKLASVGPEESDSNSVTGSSAPHLPGWTWVMPVWGQTDVWAEVRSYSILWLAFCKWEPHHTRLCSRGTFFFHHLLPSLNNQSKSESLYWYFALFVLEEKTLMEKLFPFNFVCLLKWNVPHNTEITRMWRCYWF